jgi:hypothetical protein
MHEHSSIMFFVFVWGLVLVAAFDIAILWSALAASAKCDRLEGDLSTSPGGPIPRADGIMARGTAAKQHDLTTL